jgi:hypothetical protein
MIFTKMTLFLLIWSSAEILKKTQDVNGVQLKILTSPGLTPLTGCQFITSKSVLQLKALTSS